MLRHLPALTALVFLVACASGPKPEDPAKLTAGTIGAQLAVSKVNGALVVQRLIVAGPAANAGVRHGEYIWKVDGAPVVGVSLDESVARLRGRVATNVTITVGPTEDDARELTLIRAEMPPDDHECLAGDCQNGTGQIVDRWGDRYDGQFQNGRFHGQGKLTSADGMTYEGAFVESWAAGPGTAVRSDGVRIEGNFEQGFPVGTAKATMTNGDVYEGEMNGFAMHGQGKTTRPSNGDVWSGTYEWDKLVEGSWLHYPDGGDGRTCVRAVRGGQLEPSGTINYPPKDKKKRVLFQGAFGDDCLANGQGLMTYEKKKVEGTFENDEPKKGATKVVK